MLTETVQLDERAREGLAHIAPGHLDWRTIEGRDHAAGSVGLLWISSNSTGKPTGSACGVGGPACRMTWRQGHPRCVWERDSSARKI